MSDCLIRLELELSAVIAQSVLATVEHELALKHKYDLEKVEAETHARAKAARENRDINLEQLRAAEEERRKTTIEKIKFVLSFLKFAPTNVCFVILFVFFSLILLIRSSLFWWISLLPFFSFTRMTGYW